MKKNIAKSCTENLTIPAFLNTFAEKLSKRKA